MVSQQMYALGAQPSAIRQLFAYGQRKTAEIGAAQVFNFSIGNPSVPTPAEFNQCLSEIVLRGPSQVVHGYTSAAGDDAARQAIANDLNQRFDTGYTKDHLFLTCGAAPALTTVFKALSEDGGVNEFIVSAPCFPEYQVFVEAAGGQLVVLPAETERFQIDLTALAHAINPHTRAMIVNSPNNPSGVVYGEQTICDLAALLKRKAAEIGHPIYIISDEPYREVVFHGCTVPFIPNYYPDTIVCYSYSKSLSLPGERIGYVLVPPAAAESREVYLAIAGAARAIGHVCAPSLLQQAVGRCAGLRPDISIYQRNADLLYEYLSAYGYQAVKPEGAFYLFFRSPKLLSAQQFSDLARDRYNILLVPGDGFGCPGWLRLSFCVETERIEKALPLLDKLIKEL